MYSPHQQRMRYLVEFTVPDEDGPLREEVTETSEPGADTTLPADADSEQEDTEGMCVCEMFCGIPGGKSLIVWWYIAYDRKKLKLFDGTQVRDLLCEKVPPTMLGLLAACTLSR